MVTSQVLAFLFGFLLIPFCVGLRRLDVCTMKEGGDTCSKVQVEFEILIVQMPHLSRSKLKLGAAL